MEFPKPGRYRHYKGNEYELLYIARHSETGEFLAVYKALYGEGDVWVRPLTMWDELVDVDGRRVKRFTSVDEISAPEPEELSPAEDIHALLREYYGYDEFRPGQEDVINHILAGRDTLGVMPTGAGKSVCYQIPALALDGVALVVSPLISLMKDQVNALIQMGVPAAYINTSLTERQISTALNNALSGRYKVIYVAPERLLTGRFQYITSQMNISLVAVDEAHCISQWGQDFRPAYLDVPAFIDSLPKRPRVCAFTATATERVRNDIKELMRLNNPYELVTGFDRPNLYYSVINRPDNKNKKLLELMNTYGEMNGIVYCSTRKTVEEVHSLLASNGYSATRYHAGLSEEERHRNQEEFSYGEKQIIVATNAFGMGIDKSDVRFVIHYNMPKDPESYYQEAGRAGRDGMRSDCILMYSPQDVITQNFFIDHLGEESGIDAAEAENLKRSARVRLEAMKKYSTTNKCLRKILLEYFGETAPSSCGFCENCENSSIHIDASDAAKAILGCVNELRRSYGIAVLIGILRGSRDDRLLQMGCDEMFYYGSLRDYDKATISEIIDRMLENGILDRSDGDYPVITEGRNGDRLRDGSVKIEINHLPKVSKKEKKEKRRVAKPAAAGDDLYTALRELRKKLAQERKVPAYMIFNDSTLFEMSRQKPTSERALLRVPGVGNKKAEQFGEAVIGLISEWEENH